MQVFVNGYRREHTIIWDNCVIVGSYISDSESCGTFYPLMQDTASV